MGGTQKTIRERMLKYVLEAETDDQDTNANR